ncbi:small acid-soluble spore protein P [Terrilactibacillus sp. BCM23-1]|uniref:Small acid-soluble spore protein P n=1 Tax=Terrilactibacillus tamarindi TaxID=2599694 RepID=A0A6N8CU17_9BACI|nr:small acid-soluble spore protein P [Terrilactibacillus tamarindi]
MMADKKRHSNQQNGNPKPLSGNKKAKQRQMTRQNHGEGS